MQPWCPARVAAPASRASEPGGSVGPCRQRATGGGDALQAHLACTHTITTHPDTSQHLPPAYATINPLAPAPPPLQVASFRSWLDLHPGQVMAAVNSSAEGQAGVLRAWHVWQESSSFHAQYSARWRRYVYLFPLRGPVGQEEGQEVEEGQGHRGGQSVGGCRGSRHVQGGGCTAASCMRARPLPISFRSASGW